MYFMIVINIPYQDLFFIYIYIYIWIIYIFYKLYIIGIKLINSIIKINQLIFEKFGTKGLIYFDKIKNFSKREIYQIIWN